MRWCAAIISLPPHNFDARHVRTKQLAAVSASRLARHVHKLRLMERGLCSLSDMTLLRKLTHLDDAALQPDCGTLLQAAGHSEDVCSIAAVITQSFPMHVRVLYIELVRSVPGDQASQLLVNVLSHLQQLRELTLLGDAAHLVRTPI